MNTQHSLSEKARALGPWFHNLHLPDGTQTAPDHRFGDFPAFKWQQIAPHLQEDLAGVRVLDIGCNAGFYSFALARRGATVIGIDSDDCYLRQARWAARLYGIEDRVAFRRASVYQATELGGDFDLVVFMGVLYHLRYPMLALDTVARLQPRTLLFQSLTFGPETAAIDTEAPGFDDRGRLEDAAWPKLAFIETTFAGDPTNWWVPNRAGVRAMLASAGFRIDVEPGDEIYLCRHDAKARRGWWDDAEWNTARTRLEA